MGGREGGRVYGREGGGMWRHMAARCIIFMSSLRED